MKKVNGIHHITSIVKHAQENVDFYTNVLGLRLVKQTLNFDDKSTYHFYFGNKDATSSITTTFPMSNSMEGKNGSGVVGYYRYGIPVGSSQFWREQLEHFDIFYYEYERFGEKIIAFQDPHELEIELVETRQGELSNWEWGRIKQEHAIKDIHSAALFSQQPEATVELLTNVFGYSLTNEDDEYFQLTLHNDIGGTLYVRKKQTKDYTRGTGTVHHIALSINDEDIDTWRKILKDAGFAPTDIRDRKYFRSVYFREKGGILFELATVGPSMLIDETVEELGSQLMIPPKFEQEAAELRAEMMPIFVRELDKLETYNYRNQAEYEIASKRKELLTEINTYSTIKKTRELTDEEQNKLTALRKEFIQTK